MTSPGRLGVRWFAVALALFAVVASVVTAVLFPPVQLLTAGSDASNYANAAQQYARGSVPGREFLPPDIAPADRADVRSALVKPESIGREESALTSFVFVDDDDHVRFPHQHLQPRIAAVLLRLGPDTAVPHLDRALYGVSIVLFGMVVLALTGSRVASLVGAGLFAVLPSHVELARFPMSESVATVLLLAMVWLATRPGVGALAALPLLALPHAREEFFVPLLLVLVFVTATRPRHWAPVSVGLVATSWIDLRTASTTSEFLLGSFSFEPTVTWPLPSALADAASSPLDARALMLPAAIFGLVFGHVAVLIDPVRSSVRRGIDFIRAHPWVPIALLVGITLLGDLHKADLPPRTLQWGLIRGARYGTGWLLWVSAGLVPVFGLVGLARFLPVLIDRMSAVSWLVLVPMVVGLAIDMHATPANQLWWTRRFHPAVYPLLIVGCCLVIAEANRRVRTRGRVEHCIAASVLAVLVVTQFALVGDRYPETRDGLMDGDDVAAIDEALGSIPPGAIVLCGFDGAGQKLPPLARTVHDQYGFVVWDPADLSSVHRQLAATGRPVYVDEFLLERSEVPGSWSVAVEVPNEDGFRSIPLATSD